MSTHLRRSLLPTLLALVASAGLGCSLEASQGGEDLPFETYAVSSSQQCPAPNSGDADCNAWCASTNTYPNCGCTAAWQYKSKLEKRKRGMVGAAWVEHGTTQVFRYKRLACTNGAGSNNYRDYPVVEGTFNHNHSQFWDLDAAPSALVSSSETGWTAAPPSSCFFGGYAGYCAYEGAAGCECATAYGISNGLHVCNDDAKIQVNGFANGYCTPSAATCSDNTLAVYAPF